MIIMRRCPICYNRVALADYNAHITKHEVDNNSVNNHNGDNKAKENNGGD